MRTGELLVFLVFCFLGNSLANSLDDPTEVCFVNQNTGNATDPNCGKLTNPCPTISACIESLVACCSNKTVSILLRSNITAIEGNYNISMTNDIPFSDLSISGMPSLSWDLEGKGFALSLSVNRSFIFNLDLVRIVNSSSSALQIDGGSTFLFFMSLNYVDFFNCYAEEGSALQIYLSGSLTFQNVAVYSSDAYRCGGISIYGAGRAFINVAARSSLSFVSTTATTDGGALCVDLGPNSSFNSIYTPNNVGMVSAIACSAGNDGILSFSGGSALISSIYGSACNTGGAGFLSVSNMTNLYIKTGILQQLDSVGSGSAISVMNTNLVNITTLTVQSCTTTGPNASGTIYLNSVSSASLHSLTIGQNRVTGIGGGVCIDNCEDIRISNSEFSSNFADKGASIGCMNNSNDTMALQVQMSLGRVGSVSTPIEVYSDGTCNSALWYAPTSCNNTEYSDDCSSCVGNVCAIDVICECFCSGYPGYFCPSASVSVTPTPSRTPSMTPSSQPIDSHTEIWITMVCLIAGVIVVVGLGYGIHYWYHNRNRNFHAQYQNVN